MVNIIKNQWHKFTKLVNILTILGTRNKKEPLPIKDSFLLS